MSDIGGPQTPGAPGTGPEPEMSPEQEQMLRQMEEEMRRIRVQDLIAQSVVSILNLAYRRIAKEDERDLEQARVGIDAVGALVDSLEPEAQAEIKNALAQVRMIYAQHAGGSTAAGASPDPAGGGTETGEPEGIQKPASGLWTPGSD